MARSHSFLGIGLAVVLLGVLGEQAWGQDPALADVKLAAEKAGTDANDGIRRGDTAWMLASSALVMLMVPGLALFYGGMVRRKNVLATMMQSMAALSIIGLYWLAVGYSLAFGPSRISLFDGGLVGWHWDLFFLKGIEASAYLPGTNIPVYVHVMFQGMFAIVTPALISGALAERIRFWPFCLFMVLWVTFVYCPLAHMVWAYDWFYVDPLDAVKKLGGSPIGLLGKMGALDFAGGTVVHIAAGTAGLAAALILRKRSGYPQHVVHPNSMVLTLLGAGLLWFGWFGFNGGSALAGNSLAASAFAATQAAAAAAGLSWMLVEWLLKGKPTALGLASGIVAGLVAVTPASGFVYIWGAVIIGLFAGVVCYAAVAWKAKLGYDDSLDAFGVHAIGGFLGALLTGIFCYSAINPSGADGFFAIQSVKERPDAIKKELVSLKDEIQQFNNVQALQTGEKKATTLEKIGRRKEKQARLRDELAALVGEGGVTQLITSREADKLGLAWSEAERDSDKIKGQDGTLKTLEKNNKTPLSQFIIQLKASLIALVFSFVMSALLASLVHAGTGGRFTTDVRSETDGLDQTEHGEIGFDLGLAYDAVLARTGAEPKAAKSPPGQKRFDVIVEDVDSSELIKVWSDLCVPSDEPLNPDFKELYPFVTTVQGNRFQLRGGDPAKLSVHLQKLYSNKLGKPVKVRVEEWGRISF